MLGWCIGAILTTIYAALRPEDGLRNLLLLTAPLDFSDRQDLTFARWTDEKYFDVDKVLAAFGNMPGEMIDYGAKALKPVENYLTNYCKLWDNLDDPRVVEAWHAMNTWVTDIFPMAGGAYRQLIVDLYRNNRLMKGELKIRGEIGRSEAIAGKPAERDRRGRPHYSALPVGGDPAKGRQYRHRDIPHSWRSHRHHGWERQPTSRPGLISTHGLRPAPANHGSRRLHVDAAVDVDLLTGDVIAIADEECSGLGYLLRRRQAVHGDLSLICSKRSRGMRSVISVAVNPGAITLAVMLYFASSRARTFVNAISPPLLAA